MDIAIIIELIYSCFCILFIEYMDVIINVKNSIANTKSILLGLEGLFGTDAL